MDNPTSQVSRRRWLRRGAFSLPILAAAGWFALRGHAETLPVAAKPDAAVAVTLAHVLREDVPDYLIGVGTVQPQASVTVRTRIDGQLERLGYVEGQDVRAGQVLAQLDSRALRAQFEQAQAQKARDEATLANAKVDLARYTGLIKEEATTQQTLDTQRALVAQWQAAVQTDTAQVHYAQVQLDYATITAPISGRTGARLVDVGNIVHAADAGGLVVINQIDPIAVVFTLPGDAVPAIAAAQQGGQHPQVLALARQGGTGSGTGSGKDGSPPLARGELVLLNNQIDTASGTVQLKARFANPKHVLWPGQYVNVRLLAGVRSHALTVPAEAVQRGPNGAYAFVVDANGRAQMRTVEVLQVQDGKAVIGKGLQAGETIVQDGQYKLKPGVAVVAARSASGEPAKVRP